MPRPVRLSLVRDERSRQNTKALRSKFFMEARCAIHEMGDKLGGYCFVIWDKRGRTASDMNYNHGPIAGSQVPLFAQTVLTMNAAAMLVQTDPAPQDEDPAS